MTSVKTFSGLNKDFVASYIRSVIYSLSSILRRIDSFADYDDLTMADSLKEIERKLNRLQKLMIN